MPTPHPVVKFTFRGLNEHCQMETCSIFSWCLNRQQVFIHWLWVESISVIEPNNDAGVPQNLLSAFMDTTVTRKWVNCQKHLFLVSFHIDWMYANLERKKKKQQSFPCVSQHLQGCQAKVCGFLFRCDSVQMITSLGFRGWIFFWKTECTTQIQIW